MRVEDELRRAFDEITSEQVATRIDVPRVERTARGMRARQVAGTGTAVLLVAALAAGPALRREAREPVRPVPVPVPPVNLVVAEDEFDGPERLAIAATPDGGLRELGTRPDVKHLGEVAGVVAGLSGGRLVIVTPAGVRDAGAAVSWTRARDGMTLWRAYVTSGDPWAQRVTTDGEPAGRPVRLPTGFEELVGEVEAGLVANVQRPALPGDLPRNITYTPPRTHVSKVVAVPRDGGAPRLLADNARAGSVSGEFVVVSPGDICNDRYSCDSYRLDSRYGTQVPLPRPEGVTVGMTWELSQDARLVASMQAPPGSLTRSTRTDLFDVWVRDVESGRAFRIENSRSVGSSGGPTWTHDGALTWAVRRDGVTYIAWWRPGMTAARVGTTPLGKWYIVGGTLR